MPQTKSAKKSLRQDKKRALHNKNVKENIKYLIKQFDKALITNKKSAVQEWYQKAQKAIDKATQKKILKKNTAGRKKSRLMKKLNKI